MVFDKSVSDPANITISEDFDFLYRLITSGFYRVLCKSAMGGGEVFVCRLDDNDSNFYLDGSPADLTGQEGDVMVVFLEFWYKWYKVDDNKFLYHFADHNIDGTYIHVPQSLVGAYKGYVSSNRLYSWSDVTPTTNVSLSDFRSYAKARGTGFQVIDFQQHCVIAMMLYAKYKTRNLQGVLGPGGAGSSPATTTGSSNATMYENSKDRDVIYIPYSYEDDVKKVTSKVRDLDVVYVLDVSFGADSKTVFKKWLDEGKSLMWIDHHKGIIEDSKTWGFVVPGLRSWR